MLVQPLFHSAAFGVLNAPWPLSVEILFEAVALGMSLIRTDEWTTDLPQGPTCVQVQLINVPVKHEDWIRDFAQQIQ